MQKNYKMAVMTLFYRIFGKKQYKMKPTVFCGLVAVISILFGMSSCGKTECDKTVAGDAAVSPYENIMTRTSVRQYTDMKVSAGAVDSLLRAAMAAPTAGNKQPWKFLVLDDRAVLDSVAAMAPAWVPVGRAPLAIIVCGDKELGFPGEVNDFWIQDCSAATENLLLAAHAMGLGAVWCGAYPAMDRVADLNRFFHFPPTIVPLNVVAIGYPAETPEPKQKFKSENVKYNKWQ